VARRTNAAGIALIKRFEGLRLEAYLCPAGVWTIGYGHTGNNVLPGSKITEHQANAILDVDLDKFERGVEALLPGVPLTDNEFAALVSLSFNIGLSRFEKSTLREKLLLRDKPGAAAEFLKWRLAAGKVLPGLVKRRAAERALFLRAD
jgi:lysozyme